MRNVAFKRAKHSPQVAGSLHPEFITEYAFTDLFAEGFHKSEDGYEVLPEDEFNLALAMNQSNQDEFQAEKKQQEKIANELRDIENKKQAKKDRKDEKDYQKFLKWKLDNGIE